MLMQNQGHGLKQELKLRDLVLMQIVLIVSLNSTGYAAKQGPSQTMLWLLPMLLFYCPLAIVVIKLSRAIPVEGGVYQWVKEGISPFAGYMAAWSLVIYIIGFFSSTSLQVTNGLAYSGGPGAAWIATSKPAALLVTVAVCVLAGVVNVYGLHLAKWFSGFAGILTVVTFLFLFFLLGRAVLGPHAVARQSFSFALPAASMLTLNVFTKMALFSLSGFDQCSVFAEECRKPKNDVARSVLLAAPLIALMYMVCTSAIQSYVAIGDVDVAAPISQALQAGFGDGAVGKALTVLVAGAYNLTLIAAVVVVVGMAARLPMVAGWDGLLPGWWSELHPRFRIPHKAIAAVSATLLIMTVLSILTSGNQEAVQALSAIGVGSYCIMYLLLFGAVAFGFRTHAWRPGIGVRVGAAAAFLVALVSLIFQLVPVGEVANPGVFAVKVSVAICALNGLGAWLYSRGKKRAESLVAAAAG